MSCIGLSPEPTENVKNTSVGGLVVDQPQNGYLSKFNNFDKRLWGPAGSKDCSGGQVEKLLLKEGPARRNL